MSDEEKILLAHPHLLVKQDRCDLCGVCPKYCPTKALDIDFASGRLLVSQEKCMACYVCVIVCDRGALEILWTYESYPPSP